jgi:DNA repair protein RecO (recombination protein O)
MGFLKTSGIVIKNVNTGESDKVVTLFSDTNGRIPVYARSSRRTRGNLTAACQFLCYSEFVLFEGRSMYSINSADIIEPFYEIGRDIVRLTYAAHMCDILYDVVQEEQPAPELMRMFLNTLHMLSKTDRDPELINEIFELKLLELAGFTAQPDICGACGSEFADAAYFVRNDCGIICGECRKSSGEGSVLSPGTLRALSHISGSAPGALFSFEVSDMVMGELTAITDAFLRQYLEKQYKKLDILKTLK